MDGWTEGWKDRWMDGWMYGQKNKWMDMHLKPDIATYKCIVNIEGDLT